MEVCTFFICWLRVRSWISILYTKSPEGLQKLHQRNAKLIKKKKRGETKKWKRNLFSARKKEQTDLKKREKNIFDALDSKIILCPFLFIILCPFLFLFGPGFLFAHSPAGQESIIDGSFGWDAVFAPGRFFLPRPLIW